MIKLWRFLSVSVVFAVCLGLMLVPVAFPGQGQVALASDNVTISIEPATTQVATSTSFTIDAVINNPDGMDIFIHEVHLDFDPDYFTVDSVSHVDFVFSMSPPAIDNINGTVDWPPSMNVGDKTNAPRIVSARLSCTAKYQEGVSTVSWNYTSPPPRLTKVSYGPIDYLEKGNFSLMHNGTVIIGDVFNLTVTSTGCCPIDVSGAVSGTVAAGSTKLFVVPVGSVTLNADDSAACCVFDNWTVDGNYTTSNPVIVTGAANTSHTANATCSAPQYNLTMEVNGNGTTVPDSGTTSTYDCGDVVPINAIPASGWWFVNWTTADISEIDDPSANSTTVTMDKDKTVTANFAQMYTLTMNVTGNGTTVPAVGNHTKANGTVVDITATPGSGWHFVNWTTADMSEIDDDTAALTVVTVDKNKTVTANFAINRYNLTINSTIGGNVTTPGEGTFGPYDHGTVVNLTATPDTDYAFVGWSGNVSEIADVNSSNTNITMYGNYSIMAHFAPHGISALPLSLTFTTIEGENPPSQTLEVCNMGSGTLNWSLTDGNTGWLTEAPTSGSLGEDECEDVTVSVDVTGLAAGDYSATITVTGSLVLEVPVTLHIVSAMPEVLVEPASLSASSLSISPQQVEPGQEVTISINVANTGGETGSYNAILYINEVVEDSQTVSVAGGTSKNVIFTVTKSEAGVYGVSLAGQSGQFEVVSTSWFAGVGLGTGGIIAIVVVIIVLIVAVVFILRGTRREM